MKKLLIHIFVALLTTTTSCTVKTENNNKERETFNLATYNLRLIHAGDSIQGNDWDKRAPHIADLIKFHGFDLFGTQEGVKKALDDLKVLLPGFDYFGAARDDGKDMGEHAAIFYNTDKFELLDHGDFWLSETPDQPSLGWDAACRRVCTWGKFRIINTGDTIVHFNLHMDHVGTVARAEGARLILQKINDFQSPYPVILTGDFNVDQNNESYILINNSGKLRDAYDTADFRYITSNTFNNYDPNGVMRSNDGNPARIDHIFLSPEFHVKKYGVLTDTYRDTDAEGNDIARVPSDHYPVMTVVTLQGTPKAE